MKTEETNKPEQNEAREAEYLEWMQHQGWAIAEEHQSFGEEFYHE